MLAYLQSGVVETEENDQPIQTEDVSTSIFPEGKAGCFLASHHGTAGGLPEPQPQAGPVRLPHLEA